jgi:hypothetical protein
MDEIVNIKGRKFKVKDGKIGEGVGFERIRRITGYLVGSLDRFNAAKRSEEADRVKHDGYTNFNEKE